MRLTEGKLKSIIREEFSKLEEERLHHRIAERGLLKSLEERGFEVEKNIYSHSPSKIVGDENIYYVVDSDEHTEEEYSEYTDKTYEKRVKDITISVQEKDTGFTDMFRSTEKDRFVVSGKTGSDLAEDFMTKVQKYE